MERAREYGADFWDGDRRFGYGGYRYDGRWRPFAESLIKTFQLKPNARVLDVGCGKAHILSDLKQLLPSSDLAGFDVSSYAIETAPENIRPNLHVAAAQDKYPYTDQYFDLVLSLNCLHNLKIFELESALAELERVGKNKYLVVESYRNARELFNLECWALTAESFFSPEEWCWIFDRFGYKGDYEFIFFE